MEPARYDINRATIRRRLVGLIERLPFRDTGIGDSLARGQAAIDTSVGNQVGDGNNKKKEGVHGNEATQSPSQGEARRLRVRYATRVPGTSTSVPGGTSADLPRSTATA